MAKTPTNIGVGEGGSGVAQLEALFNDIADDLAELRTQIIALAAKLDADAVNTQLDDTDYESTVTPAARKHQASDE